MQEGVIYHVYYIGPDGVLYRLNEEPLVSRAYLIPNRNMLVGPSGRYAIHVVAVNELNVSSEPSNEVELRSEGPRGSDYDHRSFRGICQVKT